jgi:hypothetical protein
VDPLGLCPATGTSESDQVKLRKPTLLERIFSKKSVPPNDLIPNPEDPFTQGMPRDSAISQYRTEIAKTGGISEPIAIRQYPDGRKMILNGHHRWEAAKQMGSKKVPTETVEWVE